MSSVIFNGLKIQGIERSAVNKGCMRGVKINGTERIATVKVLDIAFQTRGNRCQSIPFIYWHRFCFILLSLKDG